MADDQYDFNDDNAPLAADPDLAGSAEFDDMPARAAKPRSSKLPLILVLLLVVGGAGAYFAYQMFMVGGDSLPEPVRPIEVANAPAKLPEPLPPAVTPATAPQAMQPNTAEDAAKPLTPVDPNAVTASALPAPVNPGKMADVTTPAGPETKAPAAAEPTIPAPAVAAVIKNPNDPVPAEAAKAMAKDLNAGEKPVGPVVEKTAAVAEPVTKEPAKTAPKEVTAKEVPPAPSTEQLKPIDPKASASPMEKKTADTIAAVNDILGSELPSSGNKTIDDTIAKATGKKAIKKSNAPAPPTEIVSRAEQVIKVKKSYSAQSPQAMNAAGERVLQDNQYESAIDIYNKQLSGNPSDFSALAGKAYALQKAGRDTEAMDAYQRLTQLNPRDIDALTNYLGLLQKQQPEEAMTRLNSLSEQYPDNAAVSAQIGAVFAAQTDTPNALRYFMKARALDSTNPTYPFNIAVLYDRLGTSEKANDFYRAALSTAQANPDNASGVPVDAIRERMRNMNH